MFIGYCLQFFESKNTSGGDNKKRGLITSSTFTEVLGITIAAYSSKSPRRYTRRERLAFTPAAYF